MKKSWASFAETSITSDDFSRRELARIVSTVVSGRSEVEVLDSGLRLAAHLADSESLDEHQMQAMLPLASKQVVEALQKEATSARNGVRSIGGLDICDVAAALALKFDDPNLWRALIEYLTDAGIDGSLKNRALDRLSRSPRAIPTWALSALGEGWTGITSSPRQDMFFGPAPLGVFAAALRLGSILGLISFTEALSQVMILTSENERGRVEAARTIPYITSPGQADWAHALLLSMSHDANPDVRYTAGQSLVATVTMPSSMTESIVSRIAELLQSDGVSVPIRILYSLQDQTAELYASLETLKPIIFSIAGESGSEVVRGAAELVLRHWDRAVRNS